MIKKRQIKRLILVLFALVSTIGINLHTLVSPAAADCTPSGTVKRGGELRFARLEEPLTFDPTVPGDNGSIWLITQVFNTLIRVDAAGTGLEPDLAESWDISKDRLTYTFHLRDAKFSNGNPVTADDVVFSYGRAKIGSYAFIFDPLDKVEKVDAHTVKMTLKRPYTPFLSVAALFQAAIVPKDVYEANKETFGDHPVGSGPFMVQQYTRGDKVVLVPNPNYWELGADCKPLPYLDKITIPFVADSNARVLGFRNHDFDVMGNVPPNESKNIQSMSGVTLEVAPIYRVDYILLNHSDPLLSKKDFRLALNYAVDRKVILDLVFFGYGEIPNGFMPKMNYWSKDVPLIPYDVAKAQQLLTSAGYKGEPLTISIPAGDAPNKQIATIVQQFWSQVGINVQLQEIDASSFFGVLQKGTYQTAVSYITSDINDDDELATLMADFQASGFNAFFSWYKNADVTKLLQQARESADPAERTKLYAQIQQTVYWDGYSVPYNYNPVLNAYYSYVKNWKNLATGWWWLKSVWLDR